MKPRIRGARLLLSAGTAVTLAIGMLAAGSTAYAAGPTSVDLGTAANFAVLAGTTVTSSGISTITGDLGVHPGSAVTGFPPGIVHGTIHAADAVALTAKNDLGTAYDDAAGRPATATYGTLGGKTLVPGVYSAGGVVLDLTGTLTLDGQNDPNSVWVFQATSSLVTASSSSVRLINGASSCNVFWQVVSSATIGSASTFMGTIMALTSITMANGATVHGRALARNGTVTLIGDTISDTCLAAPIPTPSASATINPTASASATINPTPSASATISPTASASATISPTASASATISPTASASATTSPTASASATPRRTVTPPPTSTGGSGSSSGSTPLFALLICLAFAGLGVAAVEAQRRRIRS